MAWRKRRFALSTLHGDRLRKEKQPETSVNLGKPVDQIASGSLRYSSKLIQVPSVLREPKRPPRHDAACQNLFLIYFRGQAETTRAVLPKTPLFCVCTNELHKHQTSAVLAARTQGVVGSCWSLKGPKLHSRRLFRMRYVIGYRSENFLLLCIAADSTHYREMARDENIICDGRKVFSLAFDMRHFSMQHPTMCNYFIHLQSYTCFQIPW